MRFALRNVIWVVICVFSAIPRVVTAAGTCSSSLTVLPPSTSFTVSTPGYPSPNPLNETCTFVLEVPDGYLHDLNFTFAFNDPTDELRLYDGANITSPIMFAWSMSAHEGTLYARTKQRFLTVWYRSGLFGKTGAKGFVVNSQARLIATYGPCQQTVYNLALDSSMIVEEVSHPGLYGAMYPPDYSCVRVFHFPPGSHLRMSFASYNVMSPDSLRFFEGSLDAPERTMLDFIVPFSTTPVEPFFSISPLYMVFTSLPMAKYGQLQPDDYDNPQNSPQLFKFNAATGWVAEVGALSSLCAGVVNITVGSTWASFSDPTTPSTTYPVNYPIDGATCEWIIDAGAGKVVELKLASPMCGYTFYCYDDLALFDANDMREPLIPFIHRFTFLVSPDLTLVTNTSRVLIRRQRNSASSIFTITYRAVLAQTSCAGASSISLGAGQSTAFSFLVDADGHPAAGLLPQTAPSVLCTFHVTAPLGLALGVTIQDLGAGLYNTPKNDALNITDSISGKTLFAMRDVYELFAMKTGTSRTNVTVSALTSAIDVAVRAGQGMATGAFRVIVSVFNNSIGMQHCCNRVVQVPGSGRVEYSFPDYSTGSFFTIPVGTTCNLTFVGTCAAGMHLALQGDRSSQDQTPPLLARLRPGLDRLTVYDPNASTNEKVSESTVLFEFPGKPTLNFRGNAGSVLVDISPATRTLDESFLMPGDTRVSLWFYASAQCVAWDPVADDTPIQRYNVTEGIVYLNGTSQFGTDYIFNFTRPAGDCGSYIVNSASFGTNSDVDVYLQVTLYNGNSLACESTTLYMDSLAWGGLPLTTSPGQGLLAVVRVLDDDSRGSFHAFPEYAELASALTTRATYLTVTNSYAALAADPTICVGEVRLSATTSVTTHTFFAASAPQRGSICRIVIEPSTVGRYVVVEDLIGWHQLMGGAAQYISQQIFLYATGHDEPSLVMVQPGSGQPYGKYVVARMVWEINGTRETPWLASLLAPLTLEIREVDFNPSCGDSTVVPATVSTTLQYGTETECCAVFVAYPSRVACEWQLTAPNDYKWKVEISGPNSILGDVNVTVFENSMWRPLTHEGDLNPGSGVIVVSPLATLRLEYQPGQLRCFFIVVHAVVSACTNTTIDPWGSTYYYSTGAFYAPNSHCTTTILAPPPGYEAHLYYYTGSLGRGDMVHAYVGGQIAATYGSQFQSLNCFGGDPSVPATIYRPHALHSSCANMTIVFTSNNEVDPVNELGLELYFVAVPQASLPYQCRDPTATYCLWDKEQHIPANHDPFLLRDCTYLADVNVNQTDLSLSMQFLKFASRIVFDDSQRNGTLLAPLLETVGVLYMNAPFTSGIFSLPSLNRVVESFELVNLQSTTTAVHLPNLARAGAFVIANGTNLQSISYAPRPATVTSFMAGHQMSELMTRAIHTRTADDVVALNRSYVDRLELHNMPALMFIDNMPFVGSVIMTGVPQLMVAIDVAGVTQATGQILLDNVGITGVTSTVRLMAVPVVIRRAPRLAALTFTGTEYFTLDIDRTTVPAVRIDAPDLTFSPGLRMPELSGNVSFPSLTRVGAQLGPFSISGVLVTTLSLPQLQASDAGIVVVNTSLTCLDLPSLVTVPALIITDNPLLASIRICNLITPIPYVRVYGSPLLSCADMAARFALPGVDYAIDICDATLNGTSTACGNVSAPAYAQCADPGVTAPLQSNLTANFYIDTVIGYNCPPDYLLFGPATSVCVANLTWSPAEQPLCIPYTYINALPPPTIDAVSPGIGPLNQNVPITITGRDWNLPLTSMSANGQLLVSSIAGSAAGATATTSVFGRTMGYVTLSIVDGYGLTVTNDDLLFLTDDCPTPGTYGIGTDCHPCPVGAFCPGGNRIWPLEGWWSPGEGTGQVYPCLEPATERCLGGRNSDCGDGYDGVLCGSCGGEFYLRGTECVACPSESAQVALYAIAVAFYLAVDLLFVILPDSKLDAVIVVIKILQLVRAGTTQTGARLPDGLKQTVYYLSLVTFDFEFLTPECIDSLAGYGEFNILFWGNAIIIALLIVPTAIGLGVMWLIHPAQREFYRNRVYRAAIIQATLLYYVVATRCVQSITCVKVYDSYRLLVDTEAYCRSSAPTVVGGIGVGLLAAGMPAFFLYITHRLVRKGTWNEKRNIQRFGFLYGDLKMDGLRHFFIPLPYIHLLMVVVAWNVLKYDQQPYVMALVSLVVIFFISFAVRPFVRGRDNAITVLSYGLSLASLLLSYLALSTVNAPVGAAYGLSAAVAVITCLVATYVWRRSARANLNKIHPQSFTVLNEAEVDSKSIDDNTPDVQPSPALPNTSVVSAQGVEMSDIDSTGASRSRLLRTGDSPTGSQASMTGLLAREGNDSPRTDSRIFE